VPGLVIDVEHPILGTIELPGPSLRLERLDGVPSGRTRHEAPPLLDAQSEVIPAWADTGGHATDSAMQRNAGTRHTI
jgi:hypothetical protein